MADQILSKKKIVIIGGTTGMGWSAAQAFVLHGAQLVLVGRDPNHANEAKQLLGTQVEVLVGDARSADTATQAIDMCIDRFGGFDGLYHVAGGSGRKMGDGPLHELTIDGWNYTLDLNLTSLMLSNQAAIKKFKKLQQSGTILNTSSILGYSPAAALFATHAYAAAKSAVIGFSKSIAAYYAAYNIRVNVIVPSLFETPMSQRAMVDPNIMEYIKTKQPLDGGRVGQPQDLDGLATYFMSDQSRFTTGQVIAVDGGWSISEGQLPKP